MLSPAPLFNRLTKEPDQLSPSRVLLLQFLTLSEKMRSQTHLPAWLPLPLCLSPSSSTSNFPPSYHFYLDGSASTAQAEPFGQANLPTRGRSTLTSSDRVAPSRICPGRFVSSAELLYEQGAVERHVRGRHLPPLSHHHGYCGLRLSVGGA